MASARVLFQVSPDFYDSAGYLSHLEDVNRRHGGGIRLGSTALSSGGLLRAEGFRPRDPACHLEGVELLQSGVKEGCCSLPIPGCGAAQVPEGFVEVDDGAKRPGTLSSSPRSAAAWARTST